MDNIEQVKTIEGALLGAVLRDGTKYTEAREIVKPEHFGVNVYGWAWLACEHLHEQGIAIDTFTVGDELERMGKMVDFTSGMWSGRALLSDLRSNGEPRNVLDYAGTVQDYAIKRQLLDVMQQGAAWSMNGRKSKEIIADITKKLGGFSPYGKSDEFTVPISVAMSEAYDETDAASRGETVGVPTGFIDLDRILGSLYKDNVYLIAARPGQGKTALLLSIARNAALEGKKIAIFSLEMSRAQVANRLASQHSNVDLFKIIRGKLDECDWAPYTNAVDHISTLPITINDLSSIDISSIRQTARKIKAAGGLDLVIVDYIQLADSGAKKQERRELEVSEVSRGLKYLARELEVPVLAASQLSREIEKRSEKRPVLSDLRESGSLEQDAYAVMFIYRSDELRPEKSEIIVAKHRNGAVGSVELYFNAPFTRFDNATSKMFSTKE